MAAITTRQTTGFGATNKNAPLTNSEADANFINLNAGIANARANLNISGGGIISVDTSMNISWNQRFIVVSNSRGAANATAGYWDISLPSAGTTITGVGGASNKTVSSAGIQLNAWEALYYILPLGSSNTSLSANFRIASYTSDLDVPSNWVLICIRNGDNNLFYFPHGVNLAAGYTSNGQTNSGVPDYIIMSFGVI